MDVLRTPDPCFDHLPNFDYEPHYTDVTTDDGTVLRVAHVEAGPRNAPNTVLCMHGEPTWGFLYRKMIPVFVAAGHRVVVPDLVGFGRSDKPALTSDYTYERHVSWMNQWLVANDLRNITLVCQDWGSLIGLRLLTANLDRFDRAVLANGGLPTGDPAPNEAFMAWRNFSQSVNPFPTSKIVENGCASKPLSPEVRAAYDAPYPDETYKAGARIFPTLVPASLDYPSSKENLAAWEVLKKWTKPFHTAFGDSDPVTRNGEWAFRKNIPGCEGVEHTRIEGGGHFIQEDKAEELASFVNKVIRA